MAPRDGSSASTRAEKPIAVIGGGVSGLAAAYRLARAGHRVRLFESTGRLGGAVQSDRDGGWLIEAGPNSFQLNSKTVVALLRELGLEKEQVAANPAAKKRFIVRGAKLREAPSSLGTFLRTPLLSTGAKVRLMLEPLKGRRRRTGDLSLADFVRDHFGGEIVDYALNPFVSGVYAGDPKKLSARHAFPSIWKAEQEHGSLIRGILAQNKFRRAAGDPKSQIISFRSGLQTLVEALRAALPREAVELNASIEGIFPDNPVRLVWRRHGQAQTESFSRVILAAPAFALSKLSFGALGERPLACLESIEYPPVASLFLGYRREHVSHPVDGFGALVPAAENRAMLGVLFSSTLFPERAPQGCVALTVMIGGSLRPDLAKKSLDEIKAAVLPDLNALLGIAGTPVYERLRVWPRAIPQYQLGYERMIEAIDNCEEQFPGVLVCGHVRDGISLPACLESGLRAADRAASNLPTNAG